MRKHLWRPPVTRRSLHRSLGVKTKMCDHHSNHHSDHFPVTTHIPNDHHSDSLPVTTRIPDDHDSNHHRPPVGVHSQASHARQHPLPSSSGLVDKQDGHQEHYYTDQMKCSGFRTQGCAHFTYQLKKKYGFQEAAKNGKEHFLRTPHKQWSHEPHLRVMDARTNEGGTSKWRVSSGG